MNTDRAGYVRKDALQAVRRQQIDYLRARHDSRTSAPAIAS
jgi:hypothetical protein